MNGKPVIETTVTPHPNTFPLWDVEGDETARSDYLLPLSSVAMMRHF
jgi:hypothetical protein